MHECAVMKACLRAGHYRGGRTLSVNVFTAFENRFTAHSEKELYLITPYVSWPG